MSSNSGNDDVVSIAMMMMERNANVVLVERRKSVQFHIHNITVTLYDYALLL